MDRITDIATYLRMFGAELGDRILESYPALHNASLGYIGRHGTKRVAKAVLVSAVAPLMLKTPANPGGLPIEVFDKIRAGVLADRSQFFKDLTMAFYSYNRAGQRFRKESASRSGCRE